MKKNQLLQTFFIIFSTLVSFHSQAQTYQWAKNGYSEGYDNGNCITTDDSANVYAAGQIEYSANFNGVILNSAGKHDILVGKYDKAGNMKWLKRAGGIGGDVAWGIGVDKFHNVYVTGEIENKAGFGPGDSLTSAGSNDIFLVKYNSAGNLVWIKNIGSINDDKGRGLVVDENGYCYITGYFTGTVDFGPYTLFCNGGNDAFIAKYTPDGNCVWANKAGGTKEDRGRGIALSPTGHIYLVGTFSQSITFNSTNYTSASNNSGFIAKYDTSGNFLWNSVVSACCDTTYYRSVACDPSGNAYVIGYFMNSTTIGTTNLASDGNTDVLMAKYSPSGNVLWAKQEGGLYEDIGNHLAYDDKRDLLYTIGMYDYQVDFGTVHLNSAGNRDVYTATYDPNGVIQWARSAGGSARDVGMAIAFDTLGYLYQTGFYNTSANFDATYLNGDTLADFFVTKLSPAPSLQPTVASSSFSAILMNCNDIQLNWTPGNGTKRVVVARAIQSVNSLPVDGNDYTGNSIFGSGSNIGNANYVVYNGTGNSIQITGLTTGVEYVFYVYEYNGDYATINFNTTQFSSTSFLVNAFSFNVNPTVPTICPGGQITLTTGGALSYQWSPSTGLSATTGTTVIASPANTTTYSVDGVNNAGCHSVQKVIVQVRTLPVVQYNNVVQACKNGALFQLTGGNPSGGTYSGSGVSNGSFNPSTASTGQHIINYTYTDANGCSASDTSSVFVNMPPTISMPTFPAVCAGAQPLTLSGATPSGGVYTGTAVNSGIFNPQLAGPGTFVITYTYADQSGCQNTGNASIFVNSNSPTSITAVPALCENASSVTLSANPPGGIFSGTGVNSNTFSPSVAGAGNHTITYNASANNNCISQTSISITVNSSPNVSLSALSSACINGQPIILSGGSPAGGMYTGTGVGSGSFNPSTAGTGNHTISYSVTGINGCSNTASATLVVNALPNVTLSPFTTLCTNNQSIPLTGGFPAGGVYTGTGVANNIFNPSVSGSGNFPITYQYTNVQGCSNQAQQNLIVNIPPTVTLSLPASLCNNDSPITLNGGYPPGGSYLGQNIVNGIFDPYAVSAGSYTILYTYTDPSGCKGTKSATINVYANPTVSLGQDTTVCMGNALTLNAGTGYSSYQWNNGINTQTNIVSSNISGTINYTVTVVDGFNCSGTDAINVSFDVCNGIANTQSDFPWCYIYPNPFKNSFTMFSDKKVSIQIIDVSGRLLQSMVCKGTIEAGENLSPGVYFIAVTYNNSKNIQKVIKAE